MGRVAARGACWAHSQMVTLPAAGSLAMPIDADALAAATVAPPDISMLGRDPDVEIYATMPVYAMGLPVQSDRSPEVRTSAPRRSVVPSSRYPKIHTCT
eukprot:SAG31_NODE_5159_length_2708_cov_3.731315_2_plen_99_part_00